MEGFTFDMTALISTGVAAVLSIGLTGWVYKTLSKIIEELKKEIEDLNKELEALKQSSNKWFQKYYKLYNILVLTNRCKHSNCPVKEEFNKFISEEGEIVE